MMHLADIAVWTFAGSISVAAIIITITPAVDRIKDALAGRYIGEPGQ